MFMRFARRITQLPYSRADIDHHSRSFIESNKSSPDLKQLLYQLQSTQTRSGRNGLDGLYNELARCGYDIASEKTH